MNQTLLAVAGEVSTGEPITFYIFAPLAVIGAIGTVAARNAVHSALFLVVTMLSQPNIFCNSSITTPASSASQVVPEMEMVSDGKSETVVVTMLSHPYWLTYMSTKTLVFPGSQVWLPAKVESTAEYDTV